MFCFGSESPGLEVILIVAAVLVSAALVLVVANHHAVGAEVLLSVVAPECVSLGNT